ncbi:uncharacterized protein BDR25DRAFT_358693 [Lindgomyces ingoldianus]|uniref:Uncharacterized protein n=1 Tax=Lindgomyces ingoldianus TaxID=673940 RepID=A0ACB6QMQ0_9PLEO|nr:uncharacterized protein BDR25DRAFT_358693 [Lindgomyces ingoldianus]KAF2467592.1 hypothetical protein BDR25DRAFT_358693 [Lindgomyces ingoldianus]
MEMMVLTAGCFVVHSLEAEGNGPKAVLAVTKQQTRRTATHRTIIERENAYDVKGSQKLPSRLHNTPNISPSHLHPVTKQLSFASAKNNHCRKHLIVSIKRSIYSSLFTPCLSIIKTVFSRMRSYPKGPRIGPNPDSTWP